MFALDPFDHRLDHDLDIDTRSRELGFHRGARRGLTRHHPGVPYRVHLGEGLDIGQPDIGLDDVGLGGPGFRQRRINLLEYVLGLLGHRLSQGRIGREAGQIDLVAMNDGSAHALARLDTF